MFFLFFCLFWFCICLCLHCIFHTFYMLITC
jgi:hypothetical protein